MTAILAAIGAAALIAVVLALFSGLFSAAETGLTAASRAQGVTLQGFSMRSERISS